MSGRMDAAYHRAYRAANRERINAQLRARRALGRVRGDRSAEQAKRRSRAIDTSPLPLLYPHLQSGGTVSFWLDELRIDLAQEAELARVEGRDPKAAVDAYRARETNWFAHAAPLEMAA